MLGPVEVSLDDGRTISPFAVPPWSDDAVEEWEATQPPLIKRLRGEWICLPFGRPGKPLTDIDASWLKGLDANLTRSTPAGLGRVQRTLAVGYPPVARASAGFRRPRSSQSPGLSVAYRSPMATRRSRLTRASSLGPVANCHGVSIQSCDCRSSRVRSNSVWRQKITALTYPGVFEEGFSRIAPGRVCDGIDAVPMMDGTTRSFSSLPLPFDAEEVLLVSGHNGVARLTNRAERYRVTLEWDPKVFPGLILWISNRGRHYAPWNGRFVGLGVEPICAPFDLGYATLSIHNHRCVPWVSRQLRDLRQSAPSKPNTGSASKACEAGLRLHGDKRSRLRYEYGEKSFDLLRYSGPNCKQMSVRFCRVGADTGRTAFRRSATFPRRRVAVNRNRKISSDHTSGAAYFGSITRNAGQCASRPAPECRDSGRSADAT